MPEIPFDTFQRLDPPPTEMVCGRIGFAHDLFLSFPYEAVERLPEDGRDLVVLTGKGERGEVIASLADYPGRVVLVMAPGDAPIRDVYLPERRDVPSNFVALFATSNELVDGRVISVPLGVRSNKLRHLQFVRQNHDGHRGSLLYGNFTVNDTHYRPRKGVEHHIRPQLVDRLQGQSWLDLDVSSEQRDSPGALIRYYSQMASHRFVLSPEGSGVDCYRTWEALYLGAIPIVMSSQAMSAFADLPILFTEDYSELSEGYLEQCWEEMSARKFELDSLFSSYYSRLFLAAVGQLESPHFLCWKFDSPKFTEVLDRSPRSTARIVAETPLPPFVTCEDLMSPDGWHVPGSLCLERVEGALRILKQGDKRPMVEIPLQTIAGAPFRLTGVVELETDRPSPLTIEVEQRPDVIGAVEVGEGMPRMLELGFTARSERTVLSISAPDAQVGASWLLSDLALRALV